MAVQIMSGNEVAKQMREEMKKEVENLKKNNVVPGLAVVLVGDDPASMSYVKGKRNACEQVGIHSAEHKFATDLPEADLLKLIDKLNLDSTINGILVQLPLPKQIDEKKVLNIIDPSKDVDGFHPVNLGKMLIGEKCFLPCTPHGVQQLLMKSGIEIRGKHVVVIGRSNIVGKPVSNILFQKKEGGNATVTVCHTGTKDMAYFTKQAEILIVASGQPNTVTADMVTDGVVVVDVGVNRVPDASKKSGFRLTGDVDFDGVSQKAHAISPVPGGVGPMTITMLLYNTIDSAKLANGIA